ncbi:hypothetical protein LCGC14_2808850 [marine sediment metagenome]|uniref:Uncharacterized protein n=1 Tax=marine sediment metagenome TaxID=412755 RepID=A0A0F9AU02_9ZZZZ
MGQHTEGPWRTSKKPGVLLGDQCKYTVIETPSGWCAKVYGEDNESRANARLIAAAPELLEALQKVRDFKVSSRKDAGGDEMLDDLAAQFEALQEIARAAITKAAEHDRR